MLQEVALTPEHPVRDLVALTASYYAEPLAVDAVLHMTGLSPLAKRPYGKLSGGQKRQVQFAMAICGRPRLLFLDEPTSGLDVHARDLMWTTLRELVRQGCSIVLTTHYLEEAEALADRVAVMAAGRIIASGTVDDVRSLVARKRITCVSSVDPEQIRRWPGVTHAQVEGGRLQVTTADAETVARRLLSADPKVRELEIARAGLAEAFSELIQKVA
jgi:ABC-type multidrug transport system ATPase subunit